jgi:hypothetical protein
MDRMAEPVRIEELRRQKSILEDRLDDGYVRIGQAELLGGDVTAWEQFWFSLLGEYESVCEELLDAA